MTREKEIVDAARERADRHQIAERELNNYNSQLYFYGRIYDSEIASFEAGVKWADEHPKNIWHDANEKPTENNKNIIYQTFYQSMFNIHITFIPTCLRSCKITSCSWNEFVKEVNMKKWAYIDDLLPKGGEV